MLTSKPWSMTAWMLLSLFPMNLLAQGTWNQTLTAGPMPTRAYHAAAYDMSRERLVTYGGFATNYAAQTSTWEFDGVAWTQSVPSVSPPPRGRHAMAYDVHRNKVVLFGGTHIVFGTSSFNDTWEYDGSTWTQRHPTTLPLQRFDHAMAFDVFAAKTVMFGGRPGLISPHGDTWHWDGNDWTQASLSGPSPRYRHAMAFDVARGRTVLFAGRDISLYNDTWEWDGSAWHQMATPTSPAARSGHQMAYDIARNVTVMCGGIPAGAKTWEWDGAAWSGQNMMPSARTEHVLAYDARLQRTTMHGGTDISPVVFRSEVHTYGQTITGSFQSLNTSCAGTAATPTLVAPTSATGPMIGTTSTVQVMPTWYQTFFVFGWSNIFESGTLLPIDLAPYGMPGCSLQVSRDEITSSVPINGIASIQIPVPDNPFLVHQEFFVQGFALDLNANAGGFVTTNHLKARIGRH